MSLYLQIKELYPDIKDDEFTLQDDSDGKGAYIKEWNSSYPEPSQVLLDSVKNIAEEKEKWEKIRQKRNALLAECDWMVIRHTRQKALVGTPTLTDNQYLILCQYMQDLADIPQKQGNPDGVIFPELIL